ncbi:MAG TPA: DUF4249 family protein [Saprospiraceae bacterium]|nr:DUF4249 family protein [Saprospiraceae bacterium]
MKNSKYIFAFLALLAAACDLTQEIDLELPDAGGQPVVECYLEPGEPYRLLLTRSSAYFDDFPQDPQEFIDQILIDSAEIEIRRGAETIPLDNVANIDFDFSKLYNYSSTELVPYDTLSDFELFILLPDGSSIEASTMILPVVPIDSVVIEFPEEEVDPDSIPKARALTYISDNPTQVNYYRRMYHWNSLDSIPEQDFVTSDDFVDNGTLVFGTGFDYPVGDTLYNSIFHMTEDYYNYQLSIFNSIAANANPFAPPGLIESNVRGSSDPLGIFTGLSIYRDTTIVEE